MTEQEQYADNMMYVHEHLPTAEILAQLAEEAAELSQAALKLRRVLDGSNPTEVSEKQAIKNLLEEYADVTLCWRMVDLDVAMPETRTETMHRKAARWRRRLEDRETEKRLIDESPELDKDLMEVKKLICESCHGRNQCCIYPDQRGCPKLDSVDDLIKCALKEDAK